MEHKDLNEVVIDALRLHASYNLPTLNLGKPKTRLVVASGNALPTGKIIFEDEEIKPADEGQYQDVLTKNPQIDGAVVISASGEKHAPSIVTHLLNKGLDTYLLTCNGKSSAARIFDEYGQAERVFVTKSNEEPITYNTSTYLGMILAKTKEDPMKILNHIEKYIDTATPKNLGEYKSYYIMVPPKFDNTREMIDTKFDELFGPKVVGRCYTSEQTRHAKTTIQSDDELFISIGIQNDLFGVPSARWNIPLPVGANYASLIATTYYVVGKIQGTKPPYFKEIENTYPALQKNILFGPEFDEKVKPFEV